MLYPQLSGGQQALCLLAFVLAINVVFVGQRKTSHSALPHRSRRRNRRCARCGQGPTARTAAAKTHGGARFAGADDYAQAGCDWGEQTARGNLLRRQQHTHRHGGYVEGKKEARGVGGMEDWMNWFVGNR